MRPRLPQRPHGPALERARLGPRRADDAHAARDAARPAGRGLGHLRALPRRHRLGDHRGGRRRPSARTRTCTAASSPTSTPATSPARFARGARFQPDPRTGEARTSGTAASLAGLEAALESGDALALRARAPAHPAALRGGLRPRRPAAHLHGRRARPAQRPRLGRRPGARATTTAGCTGRRWTGTAAARRHDPATVEGRLWAGLRRLVAARRATRAAHAQGAAEPLWTGNDHVFGLLREHAGERLLLLANFTPERQAVDLAVVHERGSRAHRSAARPTGAPLQAEGDVSSSSPTSTSGCAANAIQHPGG